MNAYLLFAQPISYTSVQSKSPNQGTACPIFMLAFFYLNEGCQENYPQTYPCDLDTSWLNFFMMTLACVKLTIKNSYHTVPGPEGNNKQHFCCSSSCLLRSLVKCSELWKHPNSSIGRLSIHVEERDPIISW